MAHYVQNRTSEIVSTAMVAGRSLDNRWVTMELDKILTNTKLRENQHMKKGKNGYREHISEDSKRRASELEKNGQIYKSHSQPSSRKSKLLIKWAELEPYPNIGLIKGVDDRRLEKNDNESAKTMRTRQSDAAFDKRVRINDERKQGKRRGK